MKTQLIIAAGLAALTVAACNKPEDKTDETMAAGDTASDASATAPASDGAMAPSDSAMSGSTAAGGAGGAMAPAPQTMAPMPIEQPGASPAGGTSPAANIGHAAEAERGPRPTIPADSTGTTVPTRTN